MAEVVARKEKEQNDIPIQQMPEGSVAQIVYHKTFPHHKDLYVMRVQHHIFDLRGFRIWHMATLSKEWEFTVRVLEPSEEVILRNEET